MSRCMITAQGEYICPKEKFSQKEITTSEYVVVSGPSPSPVSAESPAPVPTCRINTEQNKGEISTRTGSSEVLFQTAASSYPLPASKLIIKAHESTCPTI